MRILFLSRWFPYPADNGSKLRVSSLLRGLCERHDVTLISFCNPAEERADPPASGRGPVETHVCAYREFEPGSGRALAGYLSGTPRYLIDTRSSEMESLIRQAVRKTRYDLVIASQIAMAAYYPAFRGIPAIFEEAELGIYWPEDDDGQSAWTRARRRLTWAKHTRFMGRLLANFELCTVASDIERRLLAAAAPGYQAVHVIPNTVEGEPAAAVPEKRVPGSLIFTGSLRYAPNHDAVTWFLNEIFPAVRAKVPGVRFTITGDAGPQAPAPDPDVVLTGRVPDVRSLLGASAVSLAPIRSGGGTRLKILEAMALRTPVVATTKAVEGIDVRDGEHLLIADTPQQFAEAVCRVLRDPAGAREMADRAWRLFEGRYDARVVVPEFLRLVDRAVAA
jgi:glycosyltransferase involved in cell wall biosynthesis